MICASLDWTKLMVTQELCGTNRVGNVMVLDMQCLCISLSVLTGIGIYVDLSFSLLFLLVGCNAD